MFWFPYEVMIWVILFAPASLDYGQPSAALWEDQLFAMTSAPQDPTWLYRGTFIPERKAIRPPIEYDNTPSLASSGSQAKIHIDNDRVLSNPGGSGYFIYSMQDLPLLENNLFGDKLRDPRLGPDSVDDPDFKKNPYRVQMRCYARYNQLIFPYRGWFRDLAFPTSRKPDVAVTDTDQDEDDTPSRRSYWLSARHDVFLHGPKSVWLFHAYKDRLFVSVELDCLNGWYRDKNGEIAKNLPKPPDRQLRTGKLPADFTEQFAVYAAGGRYHFVTPNGKAYMATPKGKAELEVSVVWNDPKRQIVGVVQDQANDAVYGWGYITDRISPDRFYVKLEPKSAATAYTLTVAQWGDRSDAYLESYECARAFRNAMKK